MADEPHDALRRLEERLSRASDAAERLIAEAARTGPRDRPPPAGWQAPPADNEASRARGGSEVEALMQALGAVRELIPPDVLDRLAGALREVLLAIRSLIDFYLERIERRPAEPVEVQDIPID